MEAAAQRAQIEQFLAEYAAAIDEDRLEQWPEFFTERCLYQIIPYENFSQGLPVALMFADSRAMLRDRVTAHRKANVFAPQRYRHLIGPLRVIGEEEEGAIVVRANYAVYRTMLDAANYGRSELFSVGVYHDRLIREQGRLLLREKVVVVETARIATLLVTPL